MKFTKEKLEAIDSRFDEMKRKNPISRHVIGIGIRLTDSLRGIGIAKDDMVFADVEELGRLVEELTMLKKAIEEETGLIL